MHWRLQSDSRKEFVAKVIEELTASCQWIQIIHSQARHPLSQGSIERANADIKHMLMAWVRENQSTNWSYGCDEVGKQ